MQSPFFSPVQLDQERCKGCYLCLPLCPNQLFEAQAEPNNAGYFPIKMVNAEYCIHCLRCVEICPDQAFTPPTTRQTNWPGYLYWLGYQYQKLYNSKNK